jgi:hypothetical protein
LCIHTASAAYAGTDHANMLPRGALIQHNGGAGCDRQPLDRDAQSF